MSRSGRSYMIPHGKGDVRVRLMRHIRSLDFEGRVRFMVRYANAYRDWLKRNGLSVKTIRAVPGERKGADHVGGTDRREG